MPPLPLARTFRPLLLTLACVAVLAGTGCGPDVADALAPPSTPAPAPPESTAPRALATDTATAPVPATTTSAAATSTTTIPATTSTTPTPTAEASTGAATPRSSLTDLVRPGPSALRAPPGSDATAVRPVSLTIDDIAVRSSPVRDVGVETDGEFEVPGAGEVGWYRFGPSPGETGSAVLAAHIAFDGRDGVFRHLADVQPGARIVVGLDDGSQRAFEAVRLAQYPKDELPFDDVFRRDGDPTLVLITCGGAFDRGTRSYDDNVVVYATPVEA